MTRDDHELDPLFRRLHLANAPRVWRELADRAEREQWSYHDFLSALITGEIAHRQQTRVQRLVRRARFPYLKTIDDFDFSRQTALRPNQLGSFLSPEFVSDGRSLVLRGRSGRGKTHLAIAIAYKAIQNGFDAYFVTAASLIDDLSRASDEKRLEAALPTYTHPAVLVVDELGYLTYSNDAANVLYHVVNNRYLKHRSMIFTTNKPLDAWGAVLHDNDLATAILDRVLERGRALVLDGPSHRTMHLGLDDPTAPVASNEPAGLTGKNRQEFPEPTAVPAGPPAGDSNDEPAGAPVRRGAPARPRRRSPLRRTGRAEDDVLCADSRRGRMARDGRHRLREAPAGKTCRATEGGAPRGDTTGHEATLSPTDDLQQKTDLTKRRSPSSARRTEVVAPRGPARC